MKPEGEDWTPAAEAARILGVTPAEVHALVHRGRLTRHPTQPRARSYFRREQVAPLANDPGRLQQAQNRAYYQRLQPIGPLPPNAEWITTNQAAALLDVAP